MTAPTRRPIRRPNMRRAVILFPSGFTLGNLFFGIFAIIAASRLQFVEAGVYVMLGGICDALDGRVARATNSGTQFGEELDSLVDAISFGLAPALIMYFAVLNRDGWDWIFVFAFTACAVLRLARFNIEQAGTAKTYFQGLPSPAAGITLASYYWFSQSSLYDYGAIANLKWHVLLRFIIAGLSMLMISNVPYPTFPRTGFRSIRAIGASLLVIGAIVLLASRRLEYFFPIALVYVAWGLLRWIFFGLFERRQPTLPYDLSEGEDGDEEEEEEFEFADSRVHASRQGHREENVARQERMRGRATRPERSDVAEPAASRLERPPRKAERPERMAEAESDRTARRDKKKDRPKRPDRPERMDRPERADRPERPARPPRSEAVAMPVTPAASSAAPPQTGVDAITLGEPDDDVMLEQDELSVGADEGSEMEGTTDAGSPTPGVAPARKRKRRRRRGERKERSGQDASAPQLFDSSTTEPPARTESEPNDSLADHDHSPYAASPAPAAPPFAVTPPPINPVVSTPVPPALPPSPTSSTDSE